MESSDLVTARSTVDNGKVMETMALMSDANTPTRKITQFVSDTIGMWIWLASTAATSSCAHLRYFVGIGLNMSPQQIRNLLRRTLGGETAEARVKEMLSRLAEEDWSEIMLLQDHFDITCAIVVQTSAQRVVFGLWGQTLAMDSTHNTNNLGYHLGEFNQP